MAEWKECLLKRVFWSREWTRENKVNKVSKSISGPNYAESWQRDALGFHS